MASRKKAADKKMTRKEWRKHYAGWLVGRQYENPLFLRILDTYELYRSMGYCDHLSRDMENRQDEYRERKSYLEKDMISYRKKYSVDEIPELSAKLSTGESRFRSLMNQALDTCSEEVVETTARMQEEMASNIAKIKAAKGKGDSHDLSYLRSLDLDYSAAMAFVSYYASSMLCGEACL